MFFCLSRRHFLDLEGIRDRKSFGCSTDWLNKPSIWAIYDTFYVFRRRFPIDSFKKKVQVKLYYAILFLCRSSILSFINCQKAKPSVFYTFLIPSRTMTSWTLQLPNVKKLILAHCVPFWFLPALWQAGHCTFQTLKCESYVFYTFLIPNKLYIANSKCWKLIRTYFTPSLFFPAPWKTRQCKFQALKS